MTRREFLQSISALFATIVVVPRPIVKKELPTEDEPRNWCLPMCL